MTNIGVHVFHCCVLHGCKYGDVDCPVTLWRVAQDKPCPYCGDEMHSEELEIRIELAVGNGAAWIPFPDSRTYSSVEAVLERWSALVLGPSVMGEIEPGELRLSWRYVTPWEPVQAPADWSGFEEV